jgi:hypothetical protein
MKQDKMQQQKKSSLLKGIALEIRAKKAQRKQLEAEKARKLMEKYQKETNKRWMSLENTSKYRTTIAKDIGNKITKTLKSELLDGLFITLKDRNRSKSGSQQTRIVRRIVEKRQAQAAHHKIGRTNDLYASNVSRRNASICMLAIRNQMFAKSDICFT